MSSIEWTDKQWNPIVGCSRVSAGCEHCYAERFAHRGMSEHHRGLTTLGKHGPRWNGTVRFLADRLYQPLRWRKPRRVFVNSMSDLFHEKVTDQQIAAVFGVMAAATHHTFQVLTKRPERMLEWFKWAAAKHDGAGLATLCAWAACAEIENRGGKSPAALNILSCLPLGPSGPLPNVWLLVSIEDQATADERIPLLLDCPAAVRGVSYEPGLGPVDLTSLPANLARKDGGASTWDYFDALAGRAVDPQASEQHQAEEYNALDWVIVGGESGPGARPFNLSWARDMIRQCKDADVACFIKQLGARPYIQATYLDVPRDQWVCGDGDVCLAHERKPLKLISRKGGDMDEWPEDLRVREWPPQPER